MLRTIQKRAELATLKQQHFLYQRKNLYVPILGRIFSGESVSDDNHGSFSLLDFLFLGSPYFIWGSVVEAERVVRIGISRKSR